MARPHTSKSNSKRRVKALRTIEKTVYTFQELSAEAKTAARGWMRNCESADALDIDTFDFETIAAIFGVEFDRKQVRLMGGGTATEPKIWYSGFNSQGDGASFEGRYAYAREAPKKIRQYAPLDTELHRIADELQRVQRKEFYRVEARIRQEGCYSHSGTMRVTVELANGDDCGVAGTSDAITQLMRGFADWIYRQIEAEYEYRMSDEAIDDNLTANEYEFDENGKRA